jgi:two-component system, cell cycle response regulator
MAKILIVDDSRLIAHIAKTILAKRGHEVILAQDGTVGLDLAQSQCPDLILLDLVMPAIDGYEVCRRLKNDPSTRDIPVIMLTSMAEPADKVKGLGMGAVDYVTKPFDEGELLARVNIHVRLKELYEALQEKNRQLQELANRDGLTGLYNHRYFQDQISKDFLRARRYNQPLACVMLDIDNFKKVNDTYGHQTGDVILQTVGRLVIEAIRDSDLAARYGGEEFGLILYFTDRRNAFEATNRLRLLIASHVFKIGEDSFHISLSGGIAAYPHPEIHDVQKLVECADRALYLAKQNGRNRVEYF